MAGVIFIRPNRERMLAYSDVECFYWPNAGQHSDSISSTNNY